MKRTHARLGKRKKMIRYANKRSDDRTIMLKEESLYKPLLVTFLMFMFILVIIFPHSIFEEYVIFMTYLRTMTKWLLYSAVATLLILPVSVLDVELISIFSQTARFSHLYVVFAISFSVFADTLFAFLGYRFSKTLRRLFAKKAKKADVEKSNARLQRYGNIGMFFFSCTPLPFTLAIYTAGAVRLKRRGFLFAVAAGRTVKYTAFALFLRLFGINLVDFFRNLFAAIFG